jgi:hypothetical protein
MSNTEPFPVDWNEWRSEWRDWLADAKASGLLTTPSRTFPGKNMLADARLGTWDLADGRTVELSEVTMPDFSKGYGYDQVRYVGITLADDTGRFTPENGIVGSFADLEAELSA